MTEKEITELSEEVLAGEEVPAEFEVRYFSEMLAGLKDEERKLRCTFRLWKAIRDDAKLAEVKTSIKKVRDCIEFVEERLGELKLAELKKV